MHATPSPRANPFADASKGLHLPSGARTPEWEYWIHSLILESAKA